MVEDLDQGAPHLRVGEVIEAAAEKGDLVARSLHLLRDLVPQIAKRFFGDRRQGAPSGERGEEEGEVADGAPAAGERFLQQARGADERGAAAGAAVRQR